MENKNIELQNISDNLSPAIYKSLEVFDTIKNTKLKIGNKTLSIEDKKLLSLFIGVYYTDNPVSKIIKLLRYNYGIEVYTTSKSEDCYKDIYEKNFSDLFSNIGINEQTNTLEFALLLFDQEFMEYFHHSLGLSLMPIRLLIGKSLSDDTSSKKLYKNAKMC